MKKALAVMCCLVIAGAGFPLQVRAAESVSRVTLEIESDLSIGADCREDDIRITVTEGECYVGEVQILNEIQQWQSDTIPMLSIYLHTDDDDTFSVKRDDITVEGGTYVSGRNVNSHIIELTVTLPSMVRKLGDFAGARWSDSTQAMWEPVQNTKYYEVLLFRDGRVTGGTRKVWEPGTDFGKDMRRTGEYTFWVRAVNLRDESAKSEWKKSEGVSRIDAAMAEELCRRYGSLIQEGITEPGQAKQQSYKDGQYGWILDGGGWWYRNGDGSYTVNNWQLIDGKWYYFDSVGYMVTGWIDWNGKSYYCDPENGDMQVSKMIQDGSGRRVDSTGAWFQ